MKNFLDYENEKITDKAFSSVLITSILGILVCIVCLCSTTFAWFSDNITSQQNLMLASGEGAISLTVEKDAVSNISENLSDDAESAETTGTADSTESTESIESNESNAPSTIILDNISEETTVMLDAGTYKVTLSLPGNTPSGYFVISAGANTYYTDYILRHENSTPQTVTFMLTVNSAQELKFTPRWGVYTQDSSVVNSSLTIQ